MPGRPRRFHRHQPRTAGAAVAVAGLAVGAAALWTLEVGAPSDATTSARVTTAPAPLVVTPSATPTPTLTPAPEPTAVGIDLAAHSTTDPESLWVIVNKQHPIDPPEFEPDDLVTVSGARVRAIVADDLRALLAAARADGVPIGLRTGYRSYGDQAAIRADVASRNGTEYADRYSARAGHSEHQTGLAVDIHSPTRPGCDLRSCFPDTAEAGWVARRAVEFGFVIRYTPENTAVTGFSPEGWHLRYVGRELAAWLTANGVTSLEEAFGVTGGPDYPS